MVRGRRKRRVEGAEFLREERTTLGEANGPEISVLLPACLEWLCACVCVRKRHTPNARLNTEHSLVQMPFY